MSSRPRRSAALRANEAITDMAEANDRPMSSRSDRRSGRTSGATVSREPPSSPDHLNLNIKVSSNKLRQATVGRDGVRTEQQISVNSRDNFVGGEIISGKRNRGGRKNYVVDSDSDEEEEEEAEAEDDESLGHDDEEEEDEDEDMDGSGEEDAEGEVDEMDVDADGEPDDMGDEDGEGDIDMDVAPASSITVGRSTKPTPKPKPAPAQKPTANAYDDDDDDDLSDPGPSDIEETITYGETMLGDDDAEGEEEEIEVAAEGEEPDAEGEEEEEEEELDSDEEGASRAETPDLSKMTRRQRARFEDTPQEYMKLSDGKFYDFLTFVSPLTPFPPIYHQYC